MDNKRKMEKKKKMLETLPDLVQIDAACTQRVQIICVTEH